MELARQISHKKKITPRYAIYTNFYNSTNNVIDNGILLYFPAPNSFTGEDVIECQTHGSPVVLQMLLNVCCELGCRLAEPGEFTKRAYLNGKIDLVQAESIIDLINAESEAMARGAMLSLQGTFSKYIKDVSAQLINLRVFIEASLDFPDEDIEFIHHAKIKDKLQVLQNDMNRLLVNAKDGVILNNGAKVVIVGKPNVGKSSLLNAMTQEDTAIVTSIPGTTRDTIKEKITISGVVFNLIDTAGIRHTDDEVEKIGINRTFDAILTADICLVLSDISQDIIEDAYYQELLDKIPSHIPRIFVHNKIDIINEPCEVKEIDTQKHIYISAKKALGVDLLQREILNAMGYNQNNNEVFTARTRHLDAIKRSVLHLNNAFTNWQQLEILAEEVRYAHNELSAITGEFTPDDLLGEIFMNFCIGK